MMADPSQQPMVQQLVAKLRNAFLETLASSLGSDLLAEVARLAKHFAMTVRPRPHEIGPTATADSERIPLQTDASRGELASTTVITKLSVLVAIVPSASGEPKVRGSNPVGDIALRQLPPRNTP
jgi:hypothetical protein